MLDRIFSSWTVVLSIFSPESFGNELIEVETGKFKIELCLDRSYQSVGIYCRGSEGHRRKMIDLDNLEMFLGKERPPREYDYIDTTSIGTKLETLEKNLDLVDRIANGSDSDEILQRIWNLNTMGNYLVPDPKLIKEEVEDLKRHIGIQWKD
ncbi:MAG TPA: hypothetical protein VGL56_10870 [Fimbriimonadaceae bacterium]